jgi:uncharacterized protein (DUF1501 family)
MTFHDEMPTFDALRRLHRVPADDLLAVDRRRFLQLVGMGLGAGLVSGPGTSLLDEALLGHDPAAWALGPVGATEGILVVIGLYGGNDGLNTVVPINDGYYYDQHGALAVDAATTLPLNDSTGLHPALSEFKRFWDTGQLAIVEGVGHRQDDFSHFTSMARWMAGRPGALSPSGWLGRWLDGHLAGRSDLFAAAEIGNSLPLHLVGDRSLGTTVSPYPSEFGLPRAARVAADQSLFSTVRSMAGANDPLSWEGRIGQAQIDQLDVATRLGPVIPGYGVLSGVEIAAKLEVAARVINANLGFRILTAGYGDFDSHADQPDQHPVRMAELNEGVQRFFATLDPAWAGRVTVMTFSEFGRTSHANDGEGTDHGSSAPQFVFGAGVKGGFYGERPSLAGLQQWDRLATPVDMRDYYGSIIDGWLGGGGADVVPGFANDLRLFARGPNTTPSFPGVVLGEFVAMAPERIYDSRDGTGGRSTRIGPGETVQVKIAGAGSIASSDVRAVAVNITSIRPSAVTWLAAYPSGGTLPDSSTLNPRAGAVVANMSVVGVGGDGMISLYNDSSDVHVTVDAMGYFRSTPAARLVALSPRRILDTREGVGAPQARVQGGSPVVLQVVGVGGVPASGVDAVIVNVAAIRPTTEGWVTAWPTGSGTQPTVASLSFRAGQVTASMVVCKVGDGGTITLAASSGDLELIGDVVGYFSSATDGSRLAPIRPSRLLDTRTGNGAPQARVGPGSEVVLQVTGRSGVPAGVTAVTLNITAVRPTQQTFVTVYPDGEERPIASSLNPDPDAVSANLVMAKLGAGGRVRLYNDVGDVDLLADVTAYVR